MKIVIEVDGYLLTQELAIKLQKEEMKKVIILENISDWDQRENGVEIINALEKLTPKERELLNLNYLIYEDPKLTQKMSDLNLNLRLCNCLKNANLYNLTVKEFFETTTVANIMKFGLGKRSLIELEKVAQKFGVSFL